MDSRKEASASIAPIQKIHGSYSTLVFHRQHQGGVVKVATAEEELSPFKL